MTATVVVAAQSRRRAKIVACVTLSKAQTLEFPFPQPSRPLVKKRSTPHPTPMTSPVVEALKRATEVTTELKKFGGAVLSATDDIPPGGLEGISLLQAKSATLMRYNYNLIRLAQARIKGEPIKPFAEKLVQDWVALEKIRPLERRLRNQIDKLLKTASRKSAEPLDDAERHRPDPSALVVNSDEEGSEAEKEDSVYRPPRLAEVVYDGGDKKAAKEKKERERARARRALGGRAGNARRGQGAA